MSNQQPMSSMIEGIMNRAQMIHRAHGGLIGYDLEDWLEAEHELFENNRPEHFQAKERVDKEPHSRGQEMNSQK